MSSARLMADIWFGYVKRAAYNLIVWAVVLAVIFPLLWMITSSFKPEHELFGIDFLPIDPTLKNYRYVLFDTPFLVFFRNSAIVAAASTILVVVVATFGAYSLVRFNYRGRRVMAQMILFTYLLPSVVLLLPLYMILSRLGLVNSLFGLVIVYVTFGLPFCLWLLRSFIAAIPADLESAAMVDGASRMRAFIDVILPQAVPGIIATAIFKFILSWNEYLYALVLINDQDKLTLPPGVILMFTNTTNIDWSALMAASTMMALPVLVGFSLLQKHLQKGFGAGAVKG